MTLSDARDIVDTLISRLYARNVDLTQDIGSAAIDAAVRYGKAVRHPAGLNLGDCFAYACARALSVPLLYNGDDSARTDLA